MITVPMTVSTAEPVAMEVSTDQNVQIGMGASIAPVSSVNGKTGAVVLDAEDVGALPSNATIVTSVNGQTGDVTVRSVMVTMYDEYGEDPSKTTKTLSQIMEAFISGSPVFFYLPVFFNGFFIQCIEIAASPRQAIFTGVYSIDEHSITIVKVVVDSQSVGHTSIYKIPQVPNVTQSDAGKFITVGSDGNLTTTTLEEWQGGDY